MRISGGWQHIFLLEGSRTAAEGFDFGASFGAAPVSSVPESRQELYVTSCSYVRCTSCSDIRRISYDRYKGVRHALISKMAMPEEILVEKDNRTGSFSSMCRGNECILHTY